MLLATLLLLGGAILVGVVWVQVRTSQRNLLAIESQIHGSMADKGRVLAKNHAIALKGLAADNAFTAMYELVSQAVDDDPDLIYGLFLSPEGEPWAYQSPQVVSPQPGAPASKVSADAWKALGLAPADLSIERLSSSQRDVFGVRVLEFAMPVVEGDDLLGTIRYGVSTGRMELALSEARELATGALNRTLWIMGIVVLVATLLMVGLGFRLATKITQPLDVLRDAATHLAQGHRDVTVHIDSGDELQVLGESFNAMARELKVSYEELEELNRDLEVRVADRTREVTERNVAMRAVLDNVDQGLATIQPDGTLLPERSQAFDRWFPTECDAPTLADAVARGDEERRLLFELCWEAIVEGLLPFEVALDQMPSDLCDGDRYYTFHYKPVFDGEKLLSVLLVATDVTEERARRAEHAKQMEFITVFQHTTRDRSGFCEFVTEAERLVAAVTVNAERTQVMRQLHTLKGNCGFFGVTSVAEVSHRLETAISDEARLLTDAEVECLRDVWRAFSKHARALVLDGAEGAVELGADELTAIIEAVKLGTPSSELVGMLGRLRLEPMRVRFGRIGRQATELAQRLGKCEVDVKVDHNNVRLPADRWVEFWAGFAHVVRNAVDHGLETTQERVSAGKPARGTLTLRSSCSSDHVTIELSDDGRGVQWQLIRDKAAAAGLAHDTQADLVGALFTDGLTSRAEVSAVSGRGVGMSAAVAACRTLGGRLELDSVEGEGTTVRVVVPLVRNIKPLRGTQPPPGQHESDARSSPSAQ